MIKNQFCVTIKRFQSNNARDYFNQVLTPYFQHEGGNSIKEDKDWDSYLINLFLIDPPTVSSLVSYQVSVLVPQFSEPPISLPHFSEPESWPLEPAPKNRMTGQVYSRKKVAIPKL
ncbi:hypothetical protein CK203_066174 [Vitis vinifera]|uniref:Uncharacterized protein n=1 Tax=Vitis vinifera TaxID=29760 RepID=A0A438G6G9_VITVI|nr:hypothetical protein CK203_066174 [Vitis vinifera]